MGNEKNNSKYTYKYSAPTEEERKEIADIKRQYEPKSIDKSRGEKKGIERLRYLNALVKNAAQAVSLTLGISGCLIFGLGLTMVLEWGARGLWIIVGGVIVGVVGIALMIASYPIYKVVLARGKKKHGAEILRLSAELLGEKEV